jgi:hypothetical protein
MMCAATVSSGAATPSFVARYDYVAPGEIGIGDVNGDGFPDIVGIGDQGLSVLLGNSKGTFVAGPVTVMSIAGAAVPVIADFNGDGKLDIAFSGSLGPGNDAPAGLVVSFGNGDGTFQPAKIYTLGSDQALGNIVVGDFNGDHVLDVAILGSPGVWIFLGNSNGTFQAGAFTSVSATDLYSMAAADFNGDGALDLAICSYTGFTVLLGNGNGTFQPALTTSTAGPQDGIVVGDVNLDGKPDLLLVDDQVTANAYALFLGKGDGTFSGPTYPDLPGGYAVAIGDVNQDGKPDLVSSYAYIALGNGKGQFGKPSFYPTESAPLGSGLVYLVDLRNNGLLDIVESNGVFVSVLLSEGKGKYEDGIMTSAPAGAGCGASADFNLDGKPDLAVNLTGGGFAIFLGTGSATTPFGAGTVTSIPGAACQFAGDFNNDGIPDLLVAVDNPSPARPTMDLYLGKGDGTFSKASSTPGPVGGFPLASYGFVALGDFNHDGNLDWVSTGNLMALGNGDGTFQTPVRLVPSCTSASNCVLYAIAAADLNHDGWTDVVLTKNGDTLLVLINNQHGGFTETSYTQGLGNSPGGVAIGDLNGDGNPDIFTTFSLYDGGAIYLGNGKGGFAYKETLSMPVDFSGMPLIADINGDGVADILIACQSTTAVYLGNGGASFAAPFYLGTGPNPKSILPVDLHGQATGAGLPDLVYPDATGFILSLSNLTK